MQILQGIAVSPGVAHGEALVLDNQGFRIPRRTKVPGGAESECARFRDAVEAVGEQIVQRRDAITAELGSQYGAIFAAHLQMIHDAQFNNSVVSAISREDLSTEYAVSRTLRDYARVFEKHGGFLAERVNDLLDLQRLLLGHLLGEQRTDLSQLTSPVIVLARRLTPTETAHLNRENTLGFVTELGGAGGHTGIVAEALAIPAVVGMGAFLANVSSGDVVIVDGEQGTVILQPDEATLERYRKKIKDEDRRIERLTEFNSLAAVTADGQRIQLLANVEFPYEIESCQQFGADGIGLYRTEFLYLGRQEEPGEDDQYQAFEKAAVAMADRPVVIRTLDLGADKAQLKSQIGDESNPMLGLRSIRLSLRYKDAFRRQLRAVLRASTHGNLRLMFPLVSTVDQLLRAKEILDEVQQQLDNEGVAFNRQMMIGMMVEVPAAVMLLDRFAEHVDFVSIGTNDLIQYTLAVDRGNKNVADLYNAADPAVLRMIEHTISSAQAAGIGVALCGQMSANPIFTMLLLGLGLRELSVPPHVLPEIKNVCRCLTISQCRDIAQRVMGMDNSREISSFLRRKLKEVAPEATASANS